MTTMVWPVAWPKQRYTAGRLQPAADSSRRRSTPRAIITTTASHACTTARQSRHGRCACPARAAISAHRNPVCRAAPRHCPLSGPGHRSRPAHTARTSPSPPRGIPQDFERHPHLPEALSSSCRPPERTRPFSHPHHISSYSKRRTYLILIGIARDSRIPQGT